jgi:hypothetical protein
MVVGVALTFLVVCAKASKPANSTASKNTIAFFISLLLLSLFPFYLSVISLPNDSGI